MGPLRGDILKKEAGIFTFNDLLHYFPFRHIDRTQITLVNKISGESEYVQVLGTITSVEIVGEKYARRLIATLYDGTGELELVWFQGINWIEKMVHTGDKFLVFGKAGFFMNSPQITHPEMELVTGEKKETRNFLEPIYPSTEKLKARSMGGRQLAKFTYTLLQLLSERDVPENICAGKKI